MKKTAVIILGLVILFTVLASACYVRPEEPRRMSYDSLRLTVWDVRQPRLPGDHSYEDEVARALNAFQELYGVEINLVFVNRREIVEFLSGDSVTTDPPALIYSTEWPVISEMMVDVTQYIDTSEYNTSAVDNWTIDGKLIGIPSFYHWLVAAAKESEEDMVTGYWLESPAFFRSLLGDWKTWNPDRAIKLASQLKESYDDYIETPLADWVNNELSKVFPVTPYMFKWLQIHTGDTGVCLLPLEVPFNEPLICATVPAYCVITREEPYLSCAVELGKALALNLGRWSIRVMGAVPAAVGDMPIFHLESGFEHENRLLLMNVLDKGLLQIPDVQEYIDRIKLESSLAPVFRDYLSGKIGITDTSKGIQDLFDGKY